MPGEAAPASAVGFDARRLRTLMVLYQEVLSAHRDELDSLNVFPVPDGDTGTNMLFTQRAVTAALAGLESPGEDDMSLVSNAVATGALRAARGNSGVILAAVLRAFVESLAASVNASAAALADAFDAADEGARHAVIEPKEGTALTVLRAAAAGARSSADLGAAADPAAVAVAALRSASETLADTRHQRPELARANVVDAGGLGVVLFIDCIRAALVGGGPGIPVGPFGPVGRAESDGARHDLGDGAFEVQLIVHADHESIARLRSELKAVGTSLAISGSNGTYAVHLHTDDPDRALAAATRAGAVEDRAVRSFDARPDETVMRAEDGAVAPARTGLVAVAEGSGLEQAFRSLGATVVVGGPGRNPPVATLEGALEATGQEGAILLPNHPNIVPAARAAVGAAGRQATVVVDASSVPAGLAAAAVYRPDAAPGDNATEMTAAAAAVRAGEVSVAAITVDTDGGPVRPGDWFAAIGDTVMDTGNDPAKLAIHLVERLCAAATGPELITVVLGDDTPSPDVDPVCAALRNARPDLRMEAIVGGQPHHRYLIGVE